MKICFPVATKVVENSTVYGHFASAPFFLVIDTDGGQEMLVSNCDSSNPLAGSNPFSALRGLQLDGIVADGIGDDAVRTMNLCGFKVYQARTSSVQENLELLASNSLPEIEAVDSHLEGRCSSGEEGHSCDHHSH